MINKLFVKKILLVSLLIGISFWIYTSMNTYYKALKIHDEVITIDTHCDIEVDGDVRESFDYFVEDNKYKCTLRTDFYPPHLINDFHFNPKGHRCVADSIIKKLEKENFNPKDYE